jgi:hypothetical protein
MAPKSAPACRERPRLLRRADARGHGRPASSAASLKASLPSTRPPIVDLQDSLAAGYGPLVSEPRL